MECSGCGATNLEGASECHRCGVALAGARPGASSRSSAAVWAVVAIGVLGVGVALLASGGAQGGSPGGGGSADLAAAQASSTAPPDVVVAVTAEATSDLRRLAEAEHEAIYSRLPESDRREVGLGAWVARGLAVDAYTGGLETATVLAVDVFDVDGDVVIVTMSMKNRAERKAHLTEAYYVREGAVWRPTMLWGREIRPATRPRRR